tara:strand:+ start:326 stop:514 length:189 start_codon:yes stop_codon:yes gene_type:complete
MEVFDHPLLQNTAAAGVKPLISLAIFALLGSFFLGALLTAVRRGIKDEGWFMFEKEKEEDSK